ncbi:hypothetical protein BDV93DRAFT_564430 [Ceratobasidium sp. AG-I]|nr:hypothetical protein BDV93DRAFT_564430 [Ceratobasidium sp. AG-I]
MAAGSSTPASDNPRHGFITLPPELHLKILSQIFCHTRCKDLGESVEVYPKSVRYSMLLIDEL